MRVLQTAGAHLRANKEPPDLGLAIAHRWRAAPDTVHLPGMRLSQGLTGVLTSHTRHERPNNIRMRPL
jgi:hypothetical protein